MHGGRAAAGTMARTGSGWSGGTLEPVHTSKFYCPVQCSKSQSQSLIHATVKKKAHSLTHVTSPRCSRSHHPSTQQHAQKLPRAEKEPRVGSPTITTRCGAGLSDAASTENTSTQGSRFEILGQWQQVNLRRSGESQGMSVGGGKPQVREQQNGGIRESIRGGRGGGNRAMLAGEVM